jgi:hypothetical protein
MNSAFFEEARPEITRIWREWSNDTPFCTKLRSKIKHYKHLCKKRAAKSHVDEDEHKAKLEAATLALQEDGDNPTLQERCGLARSKLNQL